MKKEYQFQRSRNYGGRLYSKNSSKNPSSMLQALRVTHIMALIADIPYSH